MTTLIQGPQVRALTLGRKVDRATAALPQTAAGTLFTVTGGRIVLTSIVGEVTTVIQTQANNTKLQSVPTTGSAVDLCAVLDITADEVGCLYGITGLFSDALVGAAAGASVLPRNPVIVPIGAIKLNCAASNTGAVKWSITYVPLDDNASVAAA
ncbi:hypothetical protein VA596_41670 [Amycolatopsis sp., V23-08]|uniref:Uncharacterized protein n=1 Tax=Amycolatopsis heterodermiae TaxID=3110235 RepID=A0ABU5RLT9_9PSEU|nr:hypothetical protein [Amycolatopsis sp., V23-08]MEA5366096.1 hypothetical protein [Amycolatopsis sp., V23-08]